MAHASVQGNPLGYQHIQAATPRGVLKSFPRALSADPTYIQYLQKSKRKEQVQGAARHAPLSGYCQIRAQILELEVFKDCKDSSDLALPESHQQREFPLTANVLSDQLKLSASFLSIKEKEKRKMLGLISFLLVNQATKAVLASVN